MEAESLLNALAHTLAEMEPKKLGDTVPNVKRYCLQDAQLKAPTLVHTLGDVYAEPLVDTLA